MGEGWTFWKGFEKVSLDTLFGFVLVCMTINWYAEACNFPLLRNEKNMEHTVSAVHSCIEKLKPEVDKLQKQSSGGTDINSPWCRAGCG